MIENSCAFTGHRSKKFPWKYDEADERCIALKAVLSAQIKNLIELGITDFRSGMADGVDLWAASAVLDFREQNPALKLHCDLPFDGQAEGWGKNIQEQYQHILSRADSIHYVSQEYNGSCMIERNKRLVDHAEWLLAVWKGDRRSGTGATVRYAKKQGRKIIILDPATLHIAHDPGFFTISEEKIRKMYLHYLFVFFPYLMKGRKYFKDVMILYLQNKSYLNELTERDCQSLLEQTAELCENKASQVSQRIHYMVKRSWNEYHWEWENILNWKEETVPSAKTAVKMICENYIPYLENERIILAERKRFYRGKR